MNDSAEPRLSPDFVARVLDEADRIGANRRRGRRWGALAGVAGISLGVLVWANLPPGRPDAPRTAGMQRFEDVARAAPGGRTDEPDALDDLFPDAVPVARFAEQYSNREDRGADDLLSDEDAGTR